MLERHFGTFRSFFPPKIMVRHLTSGSDFVERLLSTWMQSDPINGRNGDGVNAVESFPYWVDTDF